MTCRYDCPKCGWGPFNNEEQTCPNPGCDLHWSYMIADARASAEERRAAADNLRRVVSS